MATLEALQGRVAAAGENVRVLKEKKADTAAVAAAVQALKELKVELEQAVKARRLVYTYAALPVHATLCFHQVATDENQKESKARRARLLTLHARRLIVARLQRGLPSEAGGAVGAQAILHPFVQDLRSEKTLLVDSLEDSRAPGGVAGLYDYGPTGCAIKSNVTAFWRKVCFFFVFATRNFQLPPPAAFCAGGGHDGNRVPQRHAGGCAESIGPRGPLQRPDDARREDAGLLPR